MNHYKNLKLKIFNSLGVEVKRLSVTATDSNKRINLIQSWFKIRNLQHSNFR